MHIFLDQPLASKFNTYIFVYLSKTYCIYQFVDRYLLQTAQRCNSGAEFGTVPISTGTNVHKKV